MNRLRRSLDELTPSQRATLGLLTILVVVAAAVVVVAASSRIGDDPASSDATLTSPTSTPSTSAATTAPTTAAETTTTSTSPSSTTSTSEATTTTTTSTTIPAVTVSLRADGADGRYFGDAASEVLEYFLEVLGDPDEDTGWVDQRENYGICIGENVRFVRWGSFQLFFTDGPSDWGPAGMRHFASYTQAVYFDGERIEAETADGLSLGSPVGDIRALYGEESVFDDPIYGPVFFYDPPGAAQQWGSVTGLAPDDTIESINGSFACGE